MSRNDDYYNKSYELICNTGLIKNLKNFTHYLMEKNLKKRNFFQTVLEVGSGSGYHFQFVKHSFEKYIMSDIRVSNIDKKYLSDRRVEVKELDANTLDQILDSTIDRLIATCVLTHLPEPEIALQNWKRVVKKNGGLITIYVPTEPSLALRVFRFFGTHKKGKKLGINHKLFHYLEHKHNFILMDLLIKKTFIDFKIVQRKFPSRIFTWDFRFFDIYDIYL